MYVGDKGIKTCQCPDERGRDHLGCTSAKTCGLTSSRWWNKSFLLSSLKEHQFRQSPIDKRASVEVQKSTGEEREKGTESLFKEIKAENFQNRGRDLDIQDHEDHRSPQFQPKTIFPKTHLKN